MMRSCARRSFEAATIFIALVICCVFLTARIRRRRSISDGMGRPRASRGARLSRGEVARKFLHGRVERALQLFVKLLLLDDAAQNGRVAGFEELVQLDLEH